MNGLILSLLLFAFSQSSIASLGISSNFGKWPNGIIPIAYNPAGAPQNFQDNAKMIGYLNAAFRQWSNICDVTFDFRGITDSSVKNSEDNLVVVGWVANSDNYPMLTTPSWSNSNWYNNYLATGYTVYTDGSLEINANSTALPDDLTLNLTHELAHLLGLGHSDNPAAQLFANPYIAYPQLRTDDITGAQSIYGKPDNLAYPDLVFMPPTSNYTSTVKSAGFVKMQQGNTNANSNWVDLGSVSVFDASIANDVYVFGKIGYNNLAVGSEVTTVTVDPSGVEVARETDKIIHPDSSFFTTLPDRSKLQSLPGKWRQYGVIDNKLLFTLDLNVDFPAIAWNKPPEAAVNVQNQGAGKFKLTLSATDPENDPMSVTWYVPGQKATTDTISGGAIEKSLSYSKTGIYDTYITITDNAAHYSGSGDGFRKLINKQLVVNARENIPTYFADHSYLHIPVIYIPNSGYYSVILKTMKTKAVFKLQDISPLADDGTLALLAANFDLQTQTLTLPSVDIVSDNGTIKEFNNVALQLTNSNDPISLELVGFSQK